MRSAKSFENRPIVRRATPSKTRRHNGFAPVNVLETVRVVFIPKNSRVVAIHIFSTFYGTRGYKAISFRPPAIGFNVRNNKEREAPDVVSYFFEHYVWLRSRPY